MSTAAVIPFPDGRPRLLARLHGEDGLGLVELLIALLVLNIGIFATLGAFTGAGAAIRRASHISTASAIADQEIEALHNLKYDNIVTVAPFTWPAAQSPDGRTYTVQVTVSSGTGVQVTGGSANLKKAIVQVSDSTGVLVTNTTTFSRCTQSGLQGDSGQTPCQS